MSDLSKIEAAARAAAIDHGEWLEADADETNCDSFVAGFIAGHASRDAEIAEKDREISRIGEARDRELAVLVTYLRQIKERDSEITSLRAKLAAMREPLWMLRSEHEAETADLRARLEAAEARAAKWVTYEEFVDYAGRWWLVPGTGHVGGDRLLVVPIFSPVPLPETDL